MLKVSKCFTFCLNDCVSFSGLPSDTNVVTPNTECSWDFTTKTRSTNDDGTSLDLEWEDEEGESSCPVLIFTDSSDCSPAVEVFDESIT